MMDMLLSKEQLYSK